MKFLAVILGASLALSMQTSARFVGGVGPGELGLVFSTGLIIVLKLLTTPSWRLQGANSYVMLYWCFLFGILMWTTTVSFLAIIPGSSLRDLAAYTFCGLVIFAVVANHEHLVLTCKSFLFVLPTLIVVSYVFGGAAVWYEGIRFTSGAQNPNQFALFLLAGNMLSIMLLHNKAVILGLNLFFFGFGVFCGSDAYLLAIATILMIGLSLSVFPYRYSALLSPILAFCAVLVAFLALGLYLEVIIEQWQQADEGDGRLALFKHGLQAWLNSPFSMILGNGAGAFSGFAGSFEVQEAHSTVIDMLSIGGPLMLWIAYLPLIQLLLQSYRQDRPFLAAVTLALIVFLLFHFVGRHPVFWFTAVSAALVYHQRRSI